MNTAKNSNNSYAYTQSNVVLLTLVALSIFVLVGITSCYDSSSDDAPPPTLESNTGQGVQVSEGQVIYEENCAACHGADGSTITGNTPEALTAAMNNIGFMNGISLTAAEIQALSDFLTGNTGGDSGSGGTSDGQALYQANCEGCHGTDGSTLSGRTGAQIAAAIVNVSTMSGITLSGTEIQAIADFLGGGTGSGGTNGPPASHTNAEDGVMHAPGNDMPYSNGCTACHGQTLEGGVGPSCFMCHSEVWNESPPSGSGNTGGGSSEGQQLYTTHCASCHGVTGASLSGRTVDQISTALSNVATMNNIALSLTELQAIADYLSGNTGGDTGSGSGGGSTGGGTLDGQTLYSDNCALCHGATGSSINGTSVSAITTALNNIGSMNNISLTAEEIQAVSDYLTGNTGGGTDGGNTVGGLPATHTNSEEGVLHADGNNTPYSSGCTACHGSTLQGGAGPSCYNCHGVEWNENPPSGDGGTGTGSGTIDGQALYTANCAGCHGATGSNINGTSVSAITAAINGIGSMNNVSLTAEEIQAVSDYLTGNTSGGTGGVDSGGGVPASHTNAEDGILHAPGNNYPYTNGCTACHGLTLQGGAGPSCSACHGVKWNESAPSGDVGGGSTGGSTSEGQSLYTTHCSACHGATGSNINGRTVSAITNAMANIGSMNGISLTTTEIQAISDYLANSTGGGGSSAGGDSGGLPVNHTNSEEGVLHAPGNNYPYANGCTSCHGSNLQGGVGPSCYSCHGQEWSGSSGSGGSDGGGEHD